MKSKNAFPEIAVKRIYELKDEQDGFRILVDRLWPRGMKKSDAHIDLWLKEIGPSTGLRKWFNHEVSNWEEFLTDYTLELRKGKALSELVECVKDHKKVTLLYAAKDKEYNNAVALKKLLTLYVEKQENTGP